MDKIELTEMIEKTKKSLEFYKERELWAQAKANKLIALDLEYQKLIHETRELVYALEVVRDNV